MRSEDSALARAADVNLVPSPYRLVSVQPYSGDMSDAAISAHLIGREAYRRTRYIILEQAERCVVATIERAASQPLFSPIVAATVLAPVAQCRLCTDPEVDTSRASSLAFKARELGVGASETLIVRGRDGHVNFIHHPAPQRVEVIDIVPPFPSKLAWLSDQVVAYADLPAIELAHESIDLEHVAAGLPARRASLIPCRSSTLDLRRPTYFLDERPARRDWTLVGCKRSREIHRYVYGDLPPCIETCPRELVSASEHAQLIKCCMLEDRIEIDGNRAIVPWGTDRAHIEEALRALGAPASPSATPSTAYYRSRVGHV